MKYVFLKIIAKCVFSIFLPNFKCSVDPLNDIEISKNFARHVILIKGTKIDWGQEVCRMLGDGMHPILRIRYNLFAETETLSLSIFESIAMHIFRFPID